MSSGITTDAAVALKESFDALIAQNETAINGYLIRLNEATAKMEEGRDAMDAAMANDDKEAYLEAQADVADADLEINMVNRRLQAYDDGYFDHDNVAAFREASKEIYSDCNEILEGQLRDFVTAISQTLADYKAVVDILVNTHAEIVERLPKEHQMVVEMQRPGFGRCYDIAFSMVNTAKGFLE
jgi:hypothetical protein